MTKMENFAEELNYKSSQLTDCDAGRMDEG
jgi:hypothetical protein